MSTGIRSIALKTALMIQRMYGIVEDRGSHIVLKTPTVPDFWYGNCLAMPAAPRGGDHTAWMALFAKALPEHRHRVFLVDAPDGETGDAQAFQDDGFEINVCDVLAAQTLRDPGPVPEDIAFRPLVTDRDWEAVVALSLRVNEGGRGHDLGFLQRKFSAVRQAIGQGLGVWWGAWAQEELVADMGLFWAEGLVRFQDVETHPDHRRRGICRSLLHRACTEARRELGEPLFVIVPVDDTVRRVYESVGFSFREKTVDFFRMPPGLA